VKDPWATLCEAVYRADIPEKRSQEALSYLNQAEECFIAGTRSESVISVKPVLLYYSVLNLAKCMLAVGLLSLDLSRAQHGLSATHTGVRATLGDEIKVKTSATRVNIFGEAMKLLNGQSPKFKSLMVGHLLAQIVPAHRLWTYASQKRERFISVEITATHSQDDRDLSLYWTNAQCEQSLKIFGRALENARQERGALLNCGTLWRVAGDKGEL
jgi:hypothetical protein